MIVKTNIVRTFSKKKQWKEITGIHNGYFGGKSEIQKTFENPGEM